MVMRWGVMYQSFPSSNGGQGGICVDFQKTSSSRCSFRAFFFDHLKQLRTKMGASCWLFTLHSRMKRTDRF